MRIPNQSWEDFYSTGRTEIAWPDITSTRDAYYHVAGKIIHSWNSLEDLLKMFLLFSDIPDGIARYLGENINNSGKFELLSILADEFKVGRPEVYEYARVFFRYSSISASNRNYIAHGVLIGPMEECVSIRKPSKRSPGTMMTVTLSICDLRQMAQDMENLIQFGARVEGVMLHFPNQLSTTGNGKITAWPLLEPPPKPISVMSYVADS